MASSLAPIQELQALLDAAHVPAHDRRMYCADCDEEIYEGCPPCPLKDCPFSPFYLAEADRAHDDSGHPGVHGSADQSLDGGR